MKTSARPRSLLLHFARRADVAIRDRARSVPPRLGPAPRRTQRRYLRGQPHLPAAKNTDKSPGSLAFWNRCDDPKCPAEFSAPQAAKVAGSLLLAPAAARALQHKAEGRGGDRRLAAV